MNLTIENWRHATLREKESIARKLVSNLPSGFRFDSVQRFRLGPRQGRKRG